MGYKPKFKVHDLAFGPEFDGLEVSARGVSVGEFLEISAGVTLDRAYELFAENLVSWNLEDADDTPIPAVRDEVLKLDRQLIDRIVDVWIAAIQKVPAPLEPSSPAGEPSLVAQIPMDVPSALRAS